MAIRGLAFQRALVHSRNSQAAHLVPRDSASLPETRGTGRVFSPGSGSEGTAGLDLLKRDGTAGGYFALLSTRPNVARTCSFMLISQERSGGIPQSAGRFRFSPRTQRVPCRRRTRPTKRTGRSVPRMDRIPWRVSSTSVLSVSDANELSTLAIR